MLSTLTANEVIAFITQVVVFFGIIVAAYKAWKGEQVSTQNKAAIQQLEIRVDGRLSEVLELSKKIAFSEGKDQGREAGEEKAAVLATEVARSLLISQEQAAAVPVPVPVPEHVAPAASAKDIGHEVASALREQVVTTQVVETQIVKKGPVK